MHTNTYQRLSNEEREEISRGLARRESPAVIARRLCRSPSTISREIQRNSGRRGYRAYTASKRTAQRAASRQSGKRKLFAVGQLRTYVLAKLRLYWSPEEIVAHLKQEYPDDTTMHISHEAIYQYIYVLPRGSLKQELIKALRQEHKYRRSQGRKSHSETRGKLANMLSIEERPTEVADRTIPGHWEGDLILGKHKRTALGTLVERTTRYTLLVPLKAKDAVSVRNAYTKTINTLPREIFKTLTYDQGKEMSEHQRFTLDTGVKVYFAHPGSPWERGTNENTNGLIRQYFPKGTDFSMVSVKEIKRVQRQLNDRPRKVLEWKKPDEVINQLVALKS
jgi:transposase, IS30 family